MKKKEPWWIAIVLGIGVLLLVASSVRSMVRSWPTSPTEERAGSAMEFHGFHNAISHGEKVKLEEHLTQGKTVVFDFSSSFCPPCRMFAPRMAALDEKRDDLVVVTVDVNRPDHQGIDWASPVAKQFDLHSIPHFTVYGADGKRQADGDAARAQVEGWLTESKL